MMRGYVKELGISLISEDLLGFLLVSMGSETGSHNYVEWF